MQKNTKTIAIVLTSIVAAFVVIVGVAIAFSGGEKPDSDVTAAGVTTSAPTIQPSDPTSPTSGEPTETTAPAPTASVKELIIGRWMDSANMSGYEFFQDGTVEVTYVNLTVPVINIPVNGTAKGVYTLDGDRLTTKFSIYSATIEDTYIVKVENNSLSLKNTEDGDTATYAKAASTPPAATQPTSGTTEPIAYRDEIIGGWVNADGSVKYIFNGDGTAKVVFVNAKAPAISSSPVTDTYSGVYLSDDASIIIQYTAAAEKITEKYTFSVSKNSLSLTDEKGKTDIFVREGTKLDSGKEENELIGKWNDGAKMSGYEFKPGGVVIITYVNFTVPVVNIPINGTYTGSYTLSGDTLTMSYSIYGNSIVDTFEYDVSGNTLTLIKPDGDSATYIKE